MREWAVRRAGVLSLWLLLGAAAPRAAQADPFLAQGWQEYNPLERYEALQNYRRHRERPREQRREVERQYDRWQTMPEDERERIRENYERYRQLSPSERSRFERKYRRWKDRGED